jgi:tetratricopeptide (TPR) repeat protein
VTDAGLRSAGLLDKKFSLGELELKEKAEGTAKMTAIPSVAAKSYGHAARVLSQGKYAQAEDLAREAVAAVESFRTDDPWVARALLILAISQSAQGKFADVELTCQRALEIMENAMGPVHAELERILWNLGKSQRVQGKFVPAESNLKRSLAIAEKHSRDTTEHHAELALVYLACGRLEAQAHFRSAVDGFDTALRKEDDKPTPAAFISAVHRANYLAFLREFAALLRKRGQDDKAKKLESRADTIESSSR